jgi:hypothetical protein
MFANPQANTALVLTAIEGFTFSLVEEERVATPHKGAN